MQASGPTGFQDAFPFCTLGGNAEGRCVVTTCPPRQHHGGMPGRGLAKMSKSQSPVSAPGQCAVRGTAKHDRRWTVETRQDVLQFYCRGWFPVDVHMGYTTRRY